MLEQVAGAKHKDTEVVRCYCKIAIRYCTIDLNNLYYIYYLIRNTYVCVFIKKVNKLIYKYNLYQIETFFKVQYDCIENGLPMMDSNNIKSIEYPNDVYYTMLFGFKKLTIENYLDKKIIEELNKVK